MIISHRYRFIFIKTRKTAGTSLEVQLSSLCGDDDIFTPIYPAEQGHQARNYKSRWNLAAQWPNLKGKDKWGALQDWCKARPFRNHSTALEIKARVKPEIWQNYTKFCVERNPWDKTLSHYYMRLNRSNPPKSFEEYFSRGNYCFNYPQYCDENGDLMVDKVLTFSNLNAELAQLTSELGMPVQDSLYAQAKGKIRKDKRHYSEVFTHEQREIIEKAFEKEISLFGFTY